MIPSPRHSNVPLGCAPFGSPPPPRPLSQIALLGASTISLLIPRPVLAQNWVGEGREAEVVWLRRPVTMDGSGGRVRFSSYSHRAVYDPNNPSASCEYESFSRGIRNGGGGRENDVIVSETHRTYSDASGYERLGLARTLGRQGRSITRERFSSGEERSSQAFSSLDAGRAEDFDERWQQTATSSELDRISFLKGSSTRRQLRDQASTRQPRAPSQEEREIARQGRRVFNQHTERIVRQAREIGSGGSSTTTRRGQGRQPSAPRRAASNQDEAEALRWARQETQNLWN